MIKKIKSSLFLKIFLLLTALLVSISCLFYGIIMGVMPASYKYTLTTNYMEQIDRLITDIEFQSLDVATQKIYEFCINNNAGAILKGGNTRLTFGDDILDEQTPSQNDVAQTTSITLFLEDGAYSLQVNMSARTVNQLTETFLRLLPIVGGVVLMVALSASYFVARHLTKPILEISDISKRLTSLDMTWRCDTFRTDEIGSLAVNLNTMATRLDSTLHELTELNKKLQSDIEKERLQEKLRVDFFRAVSHELKTPITILKGELEGMIYQVGEYKDRDAHLRQSMRTVNEMETLVKEILSASRMAGADFSLTVSKIDLSQLIHKCWKKWQGLAEDKEQTCFIEIEDGLMVHGDGALLQKTISNVIGNAVTHSPLYATIRILFKDKTLQVKNSGITIDENSLTQVFEPFYRGDTSRNRKTGGSGLGLYIIKTILERHGLYYKMESIDDGICFIVQF